MNTEKKSSISFIIGETDTMRARILSRCFIKCNRLTHSIVAITMERNLLFLVLSFSLALSS